MTATVLLTVIGMKNNQTLHCIYKLKDKHNENYRDTNDEGTVNFVPYHAGDANPYWVAFRLKNGLKKANKRIYKQKARAK